VSNSIDGDTRLVAILGHPVAHSLSPRMQNAAFAARALNWAYVALDVEPEQFEPAVRGLVASGFAGANVTIPHKRAAAQLCDEADGDAVNTLVFARDGRIEGFNTDKEIVAGIDSTRVCLIGDGGAAATLLPGLHGEVRQFSRRAAWPPDPEGCDLIVNATPVTDELLVHPHEGQTVVELAYGDGETALVRAARAAGCPVIDGREALVLQGAPAFERWTGVPAPVGAMRAALGLVP
jgi:shikimate dehydrogenase